ncbi:putative membrane protein [Burkholderia cenocepacia]|uniref:Membrane protein n=1 Tax=Burkholderia cenocepacia TaxID=95486 RepID=A0AAN0VNF8_9BURK|nr:putative membrane protein [Burkholderia cenocepacia]
MNSIGIAAWVAGLLGFVLLVTGVVLISLPIGLVVAGVLLLVWAFLADLAAARAVRAGQPKE